MKKKFLLILMILSFLIEIIYPIVGFFAPDFTLRQFGLTMSESHFFLGQVIAWTLLFVALICAVAIYLLRRNDPVGILLARILGAWWLFIGLDLFFRFGRLDNLFLDSLKGALILIASFV